VVDKRYFQGLPSPAAAALVAGFVWVMLDNHFSGEDVRWYAAVLTTFAGVTMVSSIHYYSFKTINMRKSVPFIVVFLIALSFILISVDPPSVLFLLFLAYCLSGYVMWLAGMRSRPATAAGEEN
jgi:CDP-diacylglycerol--serine O-phosphatidyltransferase